MRKQKELIVIKSDPLYHNTPNPPFYLSNNNQEIRRLKSRLKQLKKDKQEPTQEYETDYFEVVENKELILKLLHSS